MDEMVWRETPTSPASSACESPASARAAFSRLQSSSSPSLSCTSSNPRDGSLIMKCPYIVANIWWTTTLMTATVTKTPAPNAVL